MTALPQRRGLAAILEPVPSVPAASPRPEATDHSAVQAVVDRVLAKFGDRAVVSVEEAGELLELGRSASYEAARSGVLPTIRTGRRLVVPVPALAALLLGVEP